MTDRLDSLDDVPRMDGRPFYYNLKHEPCSLREMGEMFEDSSSRNVAKTELEAGGMVSTIFLCIDHSFGLGGPPILYETMVFGGPGDGEQDRYTTREAALIGHDAMVEKWAGTDE